MTRKQELRVEEIRRRLSSFMYSNDYEIKRFEIEENEYFVTVYATVGLKNDEGTWAAIYGRDTVHIFIGKQGGLTYPVGKTLKNGTYKVVFRELHLDRESLLTVSMAQR